MKVYPPLKGGIERKAKALQSTQLLLILLLVGCVAALFFLWLKNRNSAPEPEPTPEPMPEPGPVIVPVPNPDFVPNSGPVPIPGPGPIPGPVMPSNQNTIYGFERTVPVYVCPRCDGENSPTRSVCCICGFEFRKGYRR